MKAWVNPDVQASSVVGTPSVAAFRACVLDGTALIGTAKLQLYEACLIVTALLAVLFRYCILLYISLTDSLDF